MSWFRNLRNKLYFFVVYQILSKFCLIAWKTKTEFTSAGVVNGISTNNMRHERTRSKPKFRYNEGVLRGLPGLEKYLTTSTLLKVFNYFLCAWWVCETGYRQLPEMPKCTDETGFLIVVFPEEVFRILSRRDRFRVFQPSSVIKVELHHMIHR